MAEAALIGDEREILLTIDEILPFVGEFKRYQWLLCAIFCIMVLPVASQVLLMYFVAQDPGWRCKEYSTLCTYNGTFPSNNYSRCYLPRSEWEFTEAKEFSIVTYFDIYCEKAWLINLSTSIIFVGTGFGSLIVGWLADNYGRKPILFISVTLITWFGFLSAFMPNIYLLICCRFIIGFFISAAYGTAIILSEIVASNYRPVAGLIIWCFFPVSLCLLGLQAYFIRSWKVLSIACSAPYFFIPLFYLFAPESPRWLRLHGKVDELIKTFEKISSFNKMVIPSHIGILPASNNAGKQKSNPLHLFRTCKMAFLTINLGYAELVTSMTYYGLSLIASDFGGSIYLNFILVSATEIPACIACIILCDKVGRKKTTVVCVALAGGVCGVLAFLCSHEDIGMDLVVVGMVAKLFVTIGFNCLTIWLFELYPTSLRAQGNSITYVISTLGSASSPWMVTGLNSLHPSAPYICMGIASISCAGLLLCLKETKRLATLECPDDYSEEECPLLKENALVSTD